MSRRDTQPVDLARVRAAEERLARLVAEKPHLAERTAAMLAGDLPCPDLEKPMSETEALRNTNLRLPAAMHERADALLSVARKAPELATAGRVTRSDVLRVAILRGLSQLEAELAGASQPGLPGVVE